ncbi:hypothetical protein PtrSN002B_006901 [Pyrenophora tritici-repentis]|uniref:DUF7730 domain-containing protein n=1 Tax=Pyrenophora tritici-repentis TaxID=45151 RepID=A0A2W1I001_9PLEO|nr:hypothetical protein PtrV1_09905 [Pyrenophora tritici-repentis]KAF7445863.1 hypothetical protein A1F99_091540 [Pyrenophora tritici-repentis]KAF7566992.1 hypothetical protein PtrM4_135830 [Pyrenophora tritici-repentis]KAG9381577.1 hypothetical protein A1F94_007231 [Pyrenophora tritici-repentis]KAI0577164.1 hypothetical protein Alg130_08496 [Pyrenophora tritici-repentis]
MGSSQSNKHSATGSGSRFNKRSAMDRGSKIPDKRTKVIKKQKKGVTPHKTSRQKLLHRNGLLNTAIAARSESMKIAKHNSNESPLLRLPGEIRTKIWEYAVGYHQIELCNTDYATHNWISTELTHVSSPLEVTTSGFVKPKYAVPAVCRQMYVEAAAMVYTLNTFSFDDQDAMDTFIRDRALGQRRLITSVDVTVAYFRLYITGARKLFCQTFPRIKRIGVHIMAAHNAQHIYSSSQKEPLEDAKQRVVDFVKEKEGTGVEVEWYGGCSSNYLSLHFR